ncbi:MAG: hypothetical protein NZ601_02945 [candidate division WOR-3 bacterium]|nr:hypothetical protein [candidate division WOR-3 bacterium]MCX7757109.1 hypothetical protein [candidate division WOR-3 bacterium]MDW7987687.1 hypothetical protein [candidate division WOR-3 bacterium]
MRLVLIVIDHESDFSSLFKFFSASENKIVLVAILPESSQDHKTYWWELFNAQEEFQARGYKVSVGTEKGSLFNIIGFQEKLHADILAVPKNLFLALGSDEYSDFLEQSKVPLILY